MHDAKPFHFQRDAFSIVEKPAQQGPSAESSGPDGRPESQAKRAASTASFREVPSGVSLRKVAGDGGCMFHSIVAGLKSACGKEVSSVQARAETIAHLRKYQSAYAPFFSGDGPGGETGLDFESYLKLMSHPAAWAGGLEAKACAAHFKITLVIVPQDASVPAFALNPKPGLPRIALWFSGEGPSAHYDWLEPSAKDGFPPALADVVREGRPEDVKRGGADEVASSAPSGWCPEPAPSPSCASSSKRLTSDVRSFFSASLARPSLEALPSSAPTEAKEAAAPVTPDLSDPPTPPCPRFDKRGRMLKPLRKRFAWKCDFCDFSTVKFRARWHHISTCMRESWGRKVAQVKWAGVDEQELSAFAWRCPFCSQGIIKDSELSGDQLLRARRIHRAQMHPKAAIGRFLLGQAGTRNAPRATQAKQAAATARRLLDLKSGKQGDHEVEAVRIPRFGKPKKKRVSAMVIVCTKCLCTAPTVAKISKSLCIGGTGRNRNSSRRKFLARLKEASQGDHAPDLLAGVRRLLEVLQPDAPTGAATSSAQPEAQADHDVEAVTWPVPCKTGYKCEVRFICTRCRSIRTNASPFKPGSCNPATAWNQYQEKSLRSLIPVAECEGWPSKAVRRVMSLLKADSLLQPSRGTDSVEVAAGVACGRP